MRHQVDYCDDKDPVVCVRGVLSLHKSDADVVPVCLCVAFHES